MDLDPGELPSADGPFATALVWINRVVETDDPQSWYELNETLRRWFAQRWISNNPQALKDAAAGSRTRDELLDVLVGPGGEDNGLFPHMWRVTRRYILEVLGPLLGEELSAGTKPRTVAPGIEAVPLFRAADLPGHDGLHEFNPRTERHALVLLLSHEQGMWFIASVGLWLPTLDWPPRIEELPVSVLD